MRAFKLNSDSYRNAVLSIIALALVVLAIHAWADTPRVHADSTPDLYIEPGTVPIPSADHLAQTQGKVVIKLENGEIWGFPTSMTGTYPVDATTHKPPVAEPIYLGKFDFAAMNAH